jgi:uncharacterized protein YggE
VATIANLTGALFIQLFSTFSPMLVVVALIIAALVSLNATGARAQNPPRQDEIILEPSAEKRVETDTATVIVTVDLAITAGNFGAARAEVKRDLKNILSKANGA